MRRSPNVFIVQIIHIPQSFWAQECQYYNQPMVVLLTKLTEFVDFKPKIFYVWIQWFHHLNRFILNSYSHLRFRFCTFLICDSLFVWWYRITLSHTFLSRRIISYFIGATLSLGTSSRWSGCIRLIFFISILNFIVLRKLRPEFAFKVIHQSHFVKWP